MTDEEKFQKKIKVLGNITFLGWVIQDFHTWGEPMLMGGQEYMARKGTHLMSYNIQTHTCSLQEIEGTFFDHGQIFVFEHEPFENCRDKLRLVRPSEPK